MNRSGENGVFIAPSPAMLCVERRARTAGDATTTAPACLVY
jgi:hypothetical protein